MSDLLKRFFFGVPAAIIALAITWLGGWYFISLAVIFMFFMQREMRRLLKHADFQTDRFFSYIIGLFLVLFPALTHRFEIATLIFILFVAFQVFKKREHQLSELVSTLYCGFYIPFGLLCIILIRQTGGNETGFFLTIIFLLMMWGNDIFAYLGGKKWGKHLMSPDISPKKTWEGFLFGLLGASVGFIATIIIFTDIHLPWLMFIPAIVVISIFGPLGDLLESKLKRAAKMKDSSTILPGHGGFFDRMDGVTLAAPAFYLYIHFLSIIGAIHF